MHSILPYLFALINLTLFTQAQQFSPLPGCKSTLCIFPSDAAEFLVGSLFDTRIEFHVLNSTYSDISILNSMQITIKIENRIIDFSEYYDTIPLLESWTFTYAKDAEHATLIAKKKEKPIPVAVVSLVWRNLVQKHVGEIEIFVRLPFKNIEKTLFWNTRPKKKRLAKNVILMISDGTSTAMISAARLIAKQSKMRSGKFLVS